MELYTNQFKDYNYDYETRTKKRKTEKFSKSIITFDIEVSSAWIKDGKIKGYKKGKSNDYWNGLQPVALPYIWQVSLDGKVYYGRELYDFVKVLNDIPSDLHCIIWVHNLSYEFFFLCNILTWDKVFARSAHKPMRATCKEFPNIEFRCSYILTRLSLAKWGEQVGVPKMTGDLNYLRLRTPLTKLTEKELRYCEYDCLVVEAGIKKYIEIYGTQDNIPMTQTGTVRRVVKDLLMTDKKYKSRIKKLCPRNVEEYKLLRDVFSGGFTHANRWYAGEVIRGHIEHYDFASSYPTVMVAEKYPMSPWVYTAEHDFPDSKRFDSFAYIFKVKFTNIESTSFNTYIQASHANGIGIVKDNGRVLKAAELYTTITEQDWITINKNYEWESVELLESYESVKDYLPRPFIKYILDLYKNKTELKDVEGQEEIYTQSKQYINSLYGMAVTAIIQAEMIFNDKTKEWLCEQLTAEIVNKKLKELRKLNPYDTRYFLSYSWGCWVTAYARRNLWKCIEACDADVLYCDTDSIFVLGEHDFKWYDEEVTSKLNTTCKELDIDPALLAPKTKKGVSKPLGVFAPEDECTEFITLGAKRYVERRKRDDKLHLTVSGINKDAVRVLKNDIENFRDGVNFDKDAEGVKKQLTTYVYDMPDCIWFDGYKSTYKYGINLRPTGYELTMTDEYKDLIDYYNMEVDDIPEQVKIAMRGMFV